MLRTRNTATALGVQNQAALSRKSLLEESLFRRKSLLEESLFQKKVCVGDFCRYHNTQAGLGAFHPPGDPAADPEHPPCCHPGQDEVVEDDEDEHRGDDGGGEGVDKLVVQLQVQVQVDGLANGCHGEDLHNSLFVTDSILGNIRKQTI